MDEQTAHYVVGGILALAGIVWLISVRFVAVTLRLASETAAPERMSLEPGPTSRDILAGEVIIETPPAGLSAKLARALAQPQFNSQGTVSILEATDHIVVFEPSVPRGRGTFKIGAIDFSAAAGQRTCACYRITRGNPRGLLIVAQAFLLLGVVTIVVCGWVMERFVVSIPQPAVRWQALQAFQVAHLLWPPFLFAGVYRANRRAVIAGFESLLTNLPHLA